MKSKIVFILFAFLLFSVKPVFPTQINTGKDVSEAKSYTDDYLFYGKSLDFTGKADDIYFFGEMLKFNGDVKSSINAVGDKLFIGGNVGNNINAGGRFVELSGNIKSNAYIMGSTIILQKGTKIDGTLFTLSKELMVKNDTTIGSGVFSSNENITLSGTVNGNLEIYAGTLTVDGVVNGNIEAKVGKIVFTSNSLINGSLKYSAEYKISDFDKSKVKGPVTYIEADKFNRGNYKWQPFKHSFNDDHKKFRAGFFKFAAAMKAIMLVVFIIAGLLLLLFPATKKLEEPRDGRSFWYTMLWGLIPFLIYPVAIVIFMILVITIPLGIILLIVGMPVILLMHIIGVTLFGQYLFGLFKWKSTKRYLYFLFGLIFFIIVSLVPFINVLGFIFFASIGWGVVLQGLINKKLA